MEEKKQAPKEQNGQKKYSYEELNHIAGDLLRQNRELTARLENAQNALDSREFQYSAFFLDSLFKVIEHPEMYTSDFVDKATKWIEDSLTRLGDAMVNTEEAKPESDEA